VGGVLKLEKERKASVRSRSAERLARPMPGRAS